MGCTSLINKPFIFIIITVIIIISSSSIIIIIIISSRVSPDRHDDDDADGAAGGSYGLAKLSIASEYIDERCVKVSFAINYLQ